MRWNALFSDMEAQLEAGQYRAAEAEVVELLRAEQAGLPLLDRLRGQLSLRLTVQTLGEAAFTGTLEKVGKDWVVLEAGPGPVLVPVAAIRSVAGMGRAVRTAESAISARLGLGSVLRALARDRTPVTIHGVYSATTLNGTIDRVGKDFCEVASVPAGEQRRRGNVTDVHAVPFAAVAAVSSGGGPA
jgi:hypothetical protein